MFDERTKDNCELCHSDRSGVTYAFQLDELGQMHEATDPHLRRSFGISDEINSAVRSVSKFLCDRCVLKDGLYKDLLIQLLLLILSIGAIASVFAFKARVWLIVVSILFSVIVILAIAAPLVYNVRRLVASLSSNPTKQADFMLENIPPYLNYEYNSDYWRGKGKKMAFKLYQKNRRHS